MTLKNCPFCGKKPKVLEIKDLTLPMLSPSHEIRCQSFLCDIKPSRIGHSGLKALLESWNRRASK